MVPGSGTYWGLSVHFIHVSLLVLSSHSSDGSGSYTAPPGPPPPPLRVLSSCQSLTKGSLFFQIKSLPNRMYHLGRDAAGQNNRYISLPASTSIDLFLTDLITFWWAKTFRTQVLQSNWSYKDLFVRGILWAHNFNWTQVIAVNPGMKLKSFQSNDDVFSDFILLKKI